MNVGFFTGLSLVIWIAAPLWLSFITEIIRPYEGRWLRAYGLSHGIVWVAYTILIGAGTIIAKKGMVAEFIDLETPPMRQLYIIYTCISIIAVAAVYIFYKCNLKLITVPENKAAKLIGKMLRVKSLTALVAIAGLSFLVIGLASMLGIYDFSYCNVNLGKVFLLIFGAVLAFKLFLALAQKGCVTRVAKAERLYEDESVYLYDNDQRTGIYAIAGSRNEFCGRVYFVRLHEISKVVNINQYCRYDYVVSERELEGRINSHSAEKVSPQKARAKVKHELFPREEECRRRHLIKI